MENSKKNIDFQEVSEEDLIYFIHLHIRDNSINEVLYLSEFYFQKFGWNIELIKSLTSLLIVNKKFVEAQKYINVLFIDLKEYAIGYVLKGSKDLAQCNISMAKSTFNKAMKLGITKEYIESLTGFQIKD